MAEDLTNITIALGSRIMDSEIKVNAIGSLLLEKGIVTEDELEDRFNSIHKESVEDIKNDLLKAITKLSNKD